MKLFQHPRLLHFAGLLLCMLVWLANNSNPPTGRTGAPFDGSCNDCHDGNNPGGFDGDMTIDGLPGTIESNTTYPLTVTITPTAGSPVKGGFQLVVVDNNDANCGDLAAGNGQSGTEPFNSREYLEHRGGKSFNGGAISWTFNWTSPVSVAGNTVKFYYIANFTNGNGQNSGDFPKAFSMSVPFTGPPPVVAVISNSTDVLCNGSNTGSATVDASGGVAPYTYHWSNNQSGQTAINLIAGTYTVTVTGSSNSGTATASVTIAQPTTLTLSTSVSGQLTCMETSVTATATVSGGTPGYDIAWGNGDVGTQATFTDPGAYGVTVTDANGCSKTDFVNITQNMVLPGATADNNGPLTCTLQNATLSGSSNTNGVTFSWAGPNGFSSNEQNPVVNAPGTYTLTVSNPANECTNSTSTVLGQNIQAPADTAHTSGRITCVVDSVEISLTTNIQNGIFYWIGPDSFTSVQRVDTIGKPGDYIGIVTNPVNGCQSRDTITVVRDTMLPGATAMASGTLNCAVSTVQLTGGPSGNNTYHWTGPNNFSASQQDTSATLPGTYTLSVTADTNGCVSTASVTVQQNTTPPVAVIAPPGNLNCNNSSLQLNATGSSQGSNFTYLWTTPDGMILSGETSQTPVVGAAGTYQLLVTNGSNFCTATASVAVVQTPPVTATTTMTFGASCYGESNGGTTGVAGGGNGVYNYLWSNGNNTASITGLAAGVYLLTVTDGENCTATTSVTIMQPPLLQANATATGETSVGANDGTATAAPTGGTPPYNYHWSNGANTAQITGLAPGSYTVSVTDNGNACTAVQTVTVNAFGCTIQGSISSVNVSCNGAANGSASVSLTDAADPVSFVWSDGDTTQSVMNLAAGSYTVSVVDGNNCPLVLNVAISQPAGILPNATATGETANDANDGTATATPTGGVGNYAYAWSNGDSVAMVTGLAPGIYTVSVSDANGCTATQSVTVNAFNCTMSSNISGINVSCFGAHDGQAILTVSGGQLPYTYLWNNGATNDTITNLGPDTLVVMVTDAVNCTSIGSIVITEPQPLTVGVLDVQDVFCPGDGTGAVQLDIQGGTGMYEISGPVDHLNAGNYTCTVTDAHQCSAEASFTVAATDSVQPILNCPANIYLCGADIVNYPEPTATDNCGMASMPALISGQPSGSAFDDGTTVQVFQASDQNGNTATCSFSVIVYPISDILIDSTADDHNGQGVGTIFISVVGNAPPYTYVWKKDNQFFSSDEDLSNLFAGSYRVVITDGNGCTTALAPVMIGNTVGTRETVNNEQVRLWPNPATETIQIEFAHVHVVAAMMLDVRGTLVQELNPEQLLSPIDIRNLPGGLYFLKIATNTGKVLTLRFAKSE